jgi:long-chain-fatty-acid--CoA ligase ACSBG
MSKDVLEYFMSLDMRILEIYGMSECSGPHLSNTYKVQKLGSIGKELPGWETKIAGEKGKKASKGELCMKGRHVMMGYLFNDAKTTEVFDADGWLRSGDIATEDADDFIAITGRIKELIITAGGENIPPVLIEDAVKSQGRDSPMFKNYS